MTRLLCGLSDWLDHRTGFRKLAHDALFEPIPGGARWRYVWGSTLVMAFMTQLVTGVFLWMAYSPSTQTAWESVFYIEHEMTGGWLLRGIHHFMAQAMVVLLAIHFVQVVWDGAYRAPRELNFVIGVILMLLVLGLALTGYLLPWDQKGYWATKVGTELASQAPLAGSEVKKLAIGGSEYGHLTLTRFFALHAGVLPGALIVFLVMHIAMFRRHGLHARHPDHARDAMFWPDQVLRDSIAALAVLAVVLGLTIYFGGAELTAPADPANPYNAARPEWYFLFLFQFLKWFPGELEVWGAFIIPGIIVLVLFLMPWIGRTRFGHMANIAVLFVLLGGAAALTAQAIHEDYFARWNDKEDILAANDPVLAAQYEASERFLAAKKQAHEEAERVIELAKSPERIPPTGALSMMYDDPYLQGPKLFKQNCLGCHSYRTRLKDVMIWSGRFAKDQLGEDIPGPDFPLGLENPHPTAPNLNLYHTPSWFAGWLHPEAIKSVHYFGYEASPFLEGEMVDFVDGIMPEGIEEPQRQAVVDAIDKVIMALTAEADLPAFRQTIEDLPPKYLEEGRALITGGLAEFADSGLSCTDCHKFHDAGDLGLAPDLTGYMSRQWMIDFIRNPAGERFYGENNDRMPAFAPHGDAKLNQLDEKSLGLIVDWLRGDWRRAEPAAASPPE